MKEVTIVDRIRTLATTSACFLLLYNFTNWVASRRHDIQDVVFDWEVYIPLVPWFIIPYWSLDLFFIAAPFAVRGKLDLIVLERRILLAICIASIFFLLAPLGLRFEVPQVEGWLGELFSPLTNFNNRWNLAPSLHIALRTILWTVFIPQRSGILRIALKIWFILIGLSTILCWQHHVIDLFTGQLLGLFVLLVVPYAAKETRARASPQHRRIALRYAVLALCFAILSFIWVPYSLLLLWPATGLLVFVIAYYTNNVQLMGKTAQGISDSARWLFLPQRHFAQAYQRRFPRQRYEVAKNVWFGSFPDDAWLEGGDFVTVIDLVAEYPEAHSKGKNYRSVAMLDLVSPTREQIEKVISEIDTYLARGSVYVHCALGLGRSAVVAAAWLLVHQRAETVDAAVEIIRARCPSAIFTNDDRLVLEKFRWEDGNNK